VSNARAIIANTACNYSAYEFFNDKQGIAMAMQMELNKKFERYMGATVEAFQISDVRPHTTAWRGGGGLMREGGGGLLTNRASPWPCRWS
jgi:hypothetical protein